jgi:hypothetical protein
LSFLDDWVYTSITDAELVDAVQAVAGMVDELSAACEEDYLAFLCPPNIATNRAVLKMSGCALAVMALWRCLGVGDEELWRPYLYAPKAKRYGAVADVLAVARRHCADYYLLGERAFESIEIGDVARIWSWGNNDHFFTFVSTPQRKANGWTAKCLHGGRTDALGKQVIRIAPTEFTWKQDKMYVGTRAIVTMISSRRLPRTLPVRLPRAWIESKNACSSST